MSHTFFCIDAHGCGNSVRAVAGGFPMMPHLSMADRREIFVQEHNWIRKVLMFEPRGHDVMSGATLYPSIRPECECETQCPQLQSVRYPLHHDSKPL